jgi:hypothetical protein
MRLPPPTRSTFSKNLETTGAVAFSAAPRAELKMATSKGNLDASNGTSMGRPPGKVTPSGKTSGGLSVRKLVTTRFLDGMSS